MRTAIYIRVSTEDQARHGYSLAEQREACGKRAMELGGREILEFCDEGASGSTLERPALSDLREAIGANRIDCLIIRDPDRLSRRLAHQLLLSEEFEKHGVRIEFLDFEWKDTPEGRLFYSIKGAVAEYEREKIRERMARGKKQKARQGGIPVNFDVYGYDYRPETGGVSVKPEEARVVGNIFSWYTEEDIGILGIAERLNKMGVPTRRRVSRWHRQVIRQILGNTVYKGQWRYGKFDRHTGLPRSPGQVIIIPVPAIIGPDIWNRAQEKMARAGRVYSRGRSGYLLSGLVTCGDCLLPMHGCLVHWWGKPERRYTCRNSHSNRDACCRPAKFIPAEPLEQAVWQQVKKKLSDPLALAREARSLIPAGNQLKKELAGINKQLKETARGRKALLDALAAGIINLDDDIKNRLEQLLRYKDHLEESKDRLETLIMDAGPLEDERLRTASARVLSGLDELSFNEKKALLRLVLSDLLLTGRPRKNNSQITVILRRDDC